MRKLIIKMIRGEKITDADISNDLFEICNNMSGNCNAACPVWKLNDGEAPLKENSMQCLCDRNGVAMAEFIKNWKEAEPVSDKFIQKHIDNFKANLQVWFEDYVKDGKTGEWESQLQEVFEGGYGPTCEWW